MKKHATIATALFLAILTLGMVSTATAANSDNNETSQVDVEVTSETALDVKPDQLTYNQVSVGDRVNVTDNDHGYESLKVENTGSEEIREIWATSELPTDNPFGSGSDASGSNHISTNFLQIRPQAGITSYGGNHSTYHYVERVEFFQDSAPLVEYDSSEFTSDGSDTVQVGRIRTGNNEFYFALGYQGTNGCSSDAELRVANDATTPDSLGTTDFRNSNSGSWTNYSISSVSGSDGYGITGDSVSLDLKSTVDDLPEAETQTYDVMTKCDGLDQVSQNEAHILLNRYDIEAGGSDNLYDGAGVASTSIYTDGGADLAPGDSFGVDVAVQVPRGVPSGNIAAGTLRLFSQAASS